MASSPSAGGIHDSFMDSFATDSAQKTALQIAFYNTLLFSLLGVCLASIFAVYQMLYMFLMPMLWASLVGTVLFPLKRMISDQLKNWLIHLDEQNRPLLVGLTLLPLQTIAQISNYIYDTALSFTGLCIALGYFALKLLCYYDAFTTLLNWISRIYALADMLICVFAQNWVFVVVLLYSLGFGAWIYLNELGQINKKFARILSLPIWLFMLARLSDMFGPLRVLMFAFCCTMLVLISAGVIEAGNTTEEHEEEERQETEGKRTKEEESPKSMAAVEAVLPDNRLDQALSSDSHLRIIGGLCALLWVVNYDALLIFIFVPFTIVFLIRRLCVIESIWPFLEGVRERVVLHVSKFVHIVVAGPLRKFFHLLFTSDRMFISGLMDRVDLISSICVMFIIAVGSLFALLFTLFQLHSETLHLVKLGGNVLSSNPDWLRYAMNYTGGHLAEEDIDQYMEQAYQQGRAWLASNVRSLADPKDPARADHLEEQAKLLVDNIYRLWEERGQRLFDGPFPTRESELARTKQKTDWEDSEEFVDGKWLSKLMHNANLAVWKTELAAIVTQNIETVLTIAHSLWHILLANVSLLSTVFVAVFSLLLGFGFELLNFVIEWLVFLTVVYYLLASSTDQWLPIKWVSDFSVSFQLSKLTGTPGGSVRTTKTLNVADAVESAINGVFVLSAKMAIFYGLYTYFVHSLFTLNVVFIPSMLATILAAIPIFPPYTVALFGVVELYLVRGEPIAALVFSCASVAPLFFADPVFYRELKGSHPYVTGLAVIGGIYWLGLQGAIIGPIILCLMVALLNVYVEFASNSRARV